MIASNWLNFILIGGALHGIFLLFAINTIKDRNSGANRYLSALIGLISLALIGRLTFDNALIQAFPHILMLPDFILFLFGPILYLYIHNLLIGTDPTRWPHFVPAGIHYCYMLFIGFRSPAALWELILSGTLVTPMYVLMISGILQNGFYVWGSYRQLFNYQKAARESFSFQGRVSYIHFILGLVSVCILTWAGVMADTLINGESPNLNAYKIIWISLTFLVYVTGFFAIRQPEIFKISLDEKKYKGSSLTDEDIIRLGGQLDKVMKEQKPYLNPKLTKLDLAKLTDINTSNLSRVINEGFNKNFFDFVNAYRVEEFIRLVKENNHTNYTFLAIAEKVGFNSKTTFNTAFKKLTNVSPRVYFKSTDHKAKPLVTSHS